MTTRDSRWLGLVFGMTCLCVLGADLPRPLTVPASGKKAGFTALDVRDLGLVPLAKFMRPRNRPISAMGNSGLAAGDVNGDGRPDLFVCGMEAPNVLYINQGGWKFADETKARGLELRGWELRGAVFADVDGDGDLDLVVTSLNGGRNWLFDNDGKGNFSESRWVAWQRFPGCGSVSATLADVDGDGDLDLYTTGFRQEFTDVQLTPSVALALKLAGMEALTQGRMAPPDFYNFFTPNQGPDGMFGPPLNNGAPGVLYLNEINLGRGIRPVTDRDMRFIAGGRPVGMRRAWGHEAVFRDVNGDGHPDLYVCNDFAWQDDFWLNDRQRSNFRMHRVPDLAMRRQSWFSMGVDFGDINRDGHVDYMTVDMLSRSHKRRKTQMGMMTVADNSGNNIGVITDRPQIMQNTLFVNRGDNTWAEIGQLAGVKASEWSWGIRFLDVDLDGYEDILVATGMNRDFMDADILNQINQQKLTSTRKQVLASRDLYQPLPTPNVAFRNQHGDGRSLRFEDVSKNWGFDTKAVSGGIAMADFDGDGDLDVVFNNLGSPLGVYRNDATAPRVAVRLRGRSPNTQGIGAKVGLIGGAEGPDGRPIEQWTEIHAGGGYASGSEALAVFSAIKPGEAGMKLVVKWRDGQRSEIKDVEANHLYLIDENTARPSLGETRASVAPMFEDVSKKLYVQISEGGQPVPLRHLEAGYDDFKRQSLLPNRLSQLGPGVAWHDVDQDGHEDLIIGAGRTGRTDIWHGNGRGSFQHYVKRKPKPEIGDLRAKLDQAGILGWTPRPGVTELLVGISNHELQTDEEIQHQKQVELAHKQGLRPPPPPAIDLKNLAAQLKLLYIAEPSVHAVRLDKLGFSTSQRVAGNLSTTGPMALADVDNDGDLDLFVGGRALPGQYPAPADSRLFLNNNGTLAPDPVANQVFKGVGLISGAVFGDLDNDGDPDLVLAREWGPVMIFKNESGKFTDATTRLGLEQQLGWWNSVALGDLNGDGRLDIIAGNWGRNSKYEQSYRKGEPLKIYYSDFDDNGQVDIIEAHTDKALGFLVPERGRDCTTRAMDYIGQRCKTFNDFGSGSLEKIIGEHFSKANALEANTLASKVFFNLGPGKGFDIRELPIEAQFAPVFGINVLDFDGDGDDDLFLAQNFFASQAETPRSDGGRGLLLENDGQGGLSPVAASVSGLVIYGEQRGSAVCDFNGDGCPDLVVTQNGFAVKLFENVSNNPGLRIRLHAGPANPTGIGCVARLKTGDTTGPARLVTAGSGYWSQDSPVLVMAADQPNHVEVRWPGGALTTTAIPKDAKEISIGQDGKLIPARKN